MTQNDSKAATDLLTSKLGRRYALSLLGASGIATPFALGAQKATDHNIPNVIQDWILGQQSNPTVLANLYTISDSAG